MESIVSNTETLELWLHWNYKSWKFATKALADDFVKFWNFNPTQYWMSYNMSYRGFDITQAESYTRCNYQWAKKDWDLGDPIGFRQTIEECKEAIDEVLEVI